MWLLLSTPLPVIFQPQQWQRGCKNRAGGGHPEVCTGTSHSSSRGWGFGTPLWWDWGWERWMSCSVKVGDEAGKCYLSLMLCWAHRTLNDSVVFHWVWVISAINFWMGGHPFTLSDWHPLRQPCLTSVSVNSTKTCHITCLLMPNVHTKTVNLKMVLMLKMACIHTLVFSDCLCDDLHPWPYSPLWFPKAIIRFIHSGGHF